MLPKAGLRYVFPVPRLLSSEMPSAVPEHFLEVCFGIADDPRDLLSQSGQGCGEILGGGRLANADFDVDGNLHHIAPKLFNI